MKLSDLPEDFTDAQFKSLDKESLDKIPFDRIRWLCQCKGCTNGTHVRDYGLEKWYFLDRNSKAAEKNPREYWMGINNIWLCGRHNKIITRLEKSFSYEQIYRRFIDPDKKVLIR